MSDSTQTTNTPHKAINFADKLSKFDSLWTPKVIAEMNDYQFKIVKLEGEFVWHQHDDTDETFIVLEGSLNIEFRDCSVTIDQGEMYVVPAGVEHKPIAKQLVKAIIIEPRGVINTGDNDKGNLTAENDVWI